MSDEAPGPAQGEESAPQAGSLRARLAASLATEGDARTPPQPSPPAVGPFDRDFWRSPLRGRWLTSFLGSMLLPLVVISGLTGFLSQAAYDPDLGSNAVTDGFDKGFYFFDWPTHPVWLYSLTQSLHVICGLAAIPILFAKLWSVIPKLFERPPVRSTAIALERLSIATLVGSSLFLFATGTMNILYWRVFPFPFVQAHYYAAIVFVAALTLHVAVRLPIVAASFRREGVFRPLGEGIALMRVVDPAEDPLAPTLPSQPTISRRGLIGAVAGAAAGITLLQLPTNLLSPVRQLAILSPRGQSYGDGPTDFQINKTAKAATIDPAKTGPSWRLTLAGGGGEIELSRPELLAMELHAEHLPIACVEGWTTWEDWTGVRLADLAAQAGAGEGVGVFVESLQPAGAFAQTTLNPGQVADERSLLALKVNGADLSLDHGYPARIIVPALPGVHNTKWVRKLTFEEV